MLTKLPLSGLRFEKRVWLVIWGLCWSLSSSVWAADELQVGLASVEITPPPQYRMSGYYNERLNTGTHDPLYAKALYFEQGDTRACVVCCDLIGLDPQVVQGARKILAEKGVLPATNLAVSATHSHTGPLYYGSLRDFFHDEAVKRDGKDVHEVLDYREFLREKLVEAVIAAQQDKRPRHLRAGSVEQTGLSFNRRFHMKDGTVRFNPGKLNPDIVRVAGPIDPQVGLIAVDGQTEAPAALWTIFALHLDTVGGTDYSADYPFHLERSLQSKWGPKFLSLFGAGTCGDINHIDVTHNQPQKGHEEAGRIGQTLAQTVSKAVPTLRPIEHPHLGFKQTVVSVPRQTFTPQQLTESRQNMYKIGTRDLPFLDQVAAVKIVSLAKLPEMLALDVQVLRLDDQTAVVFLPGEVFVELGLAIKQSSPFATTLVVELSNDSPKYVPTEKAFREGSYETVNSVVQTGGGEQLVAAAKKLLAELKEQP